MFDGLRARLLGISSGIVLALGIAFVLGGVAMANQLPPGRAKMPGQSAPGISPLVRAAPSAGITNSFPIQGRLTDAAGTPLNGSYSIRMRLWTAPTGGSMWCEDTDEVMVVGGLFTTYFDNCGPSSFHGGTFNFHLGIQVNGDPEMSPRQPLSPVPYAYTLVDGTAIDRIYSVTETEIAISPLKFVQSGSSSLTIQPLPEGYIRIDPNTAGTHFLYVPVDVPSKLYGSQFRFRRLRVCYQADSTSNIISTTTVRTSSDDGGAVDLKIDVVDRTSPVWDCYTVSDGTQHYIDGPLVLQFSLICANATDRIRIGKIVITLAQSS